MDAGVNTPINTVDTQYIRVLCTCTRMGLYIYVCVYLELNMEARPNAIVADY